MYGLGGRGWVPLRDGEGRCSEMLARASFLHRKREDAERRAPACALAAGARHSVSHCQMGFIIDNLAAHRYAN